MKIFALSWFIPNVQREEIILTSSMHPKIFFVIKRLMG